jgi:hypothetical protein
VRLNFKWGYERGGDLVSKSLSGFSNKGRGIDRAAVETPFGEELQFEDNLFQYTFYHSTLPSVHVWGSGGGQKI